MDKGGRDRGRTGVEVGKLGKGVTMGGEAPRQVWFDDRCSLPAALKIRTKQSGSTLIGVQGKNDTRTRTS